MTKTESANTRCDESAGRVAPVVDRNRCEGKEDCVRVCPYSVFSVAKLEPETRRGLSLRGKIKGWAHGWKQAVVLHPDQCHACGLCVAACPEKALKLRKVSDDA